MAYSPEILGIFNKGVREKLRSIAICDIFKP